MNVQLQINHRFRDMALQIAFTAPQGITALFGPSGAGKSSVINAVAGLLRPDHGHISVEDRVLFDSAKGIDLPAHKRNVGYVFQEARLFPHLNVKQNLNYGRAFTRSRHRNQSFDHITELLQLGPLLSRHTAALSGGEKARVALGRAILSEPKILLLDEPLAALDDARKAEILPYFEQMRDALNLPILYVSHSISEVSRLATTVVHLEKGQVVKTASADQINADQGFSLLAHIRGPAQTGRLHLHTAGGTIELPAQPQPAGKVALFIRYDQILLSRDPANALLGTQTLAADLRQITAIGPDLRLQLAIGAEEFSYLLPQATAAEGLVAGQKLYIVLTHSPKLVPA